MATGAFEDLEVYQLAERLADEVWGVVRSWENFSRDTVGKQRSLVLCPWFLVLGRGGWHGDGGV